MSAEITREERRLIDEAIAEGRVTKCPPGATSLVKYRWNGRFLEAVGSGVPRHRFARERARRRTVKAMYEAGKTREEIMKAEGISESVFRRDLQVLGLWDDSPYSRQSITGMSPQRKSVRAAWAPDRTTRQIAEITGLSRHAVRAHLRRLGLKQAPDHRGGRNG